MAIYKIFPTKDTSLYTISQSMNTGLDEILEASTYIRDTLPQVSRYLLQFSQPEIDNWVTSYISGSGVLGETYSVISSFPDASDFLFDQTMVAGPTYPTSSDGQGLNNSFGPWDLIPSSSTGNGRGQHFNVQAHGSYFIPNRDIVSKQPITPTLTANNGTYGPLILSNDQAGVNLTSSLSASVNLTIHDNQITAATIVNNGSASYVTSTLPGTDASSPYFSYFDNNDLYLTQTAVDAALGAGVISNIDTNGDAELYFKIGADDLVTTISVLEGVKPYGIGYRPGDKLIFKSESFSDYPMSDDITITLSSPTVSGSNWGNREFGVDLRNSAAVVNGLNIDQELKIYPVSGSWGMGSGKLFNSPSTTDGASWTWRTYSGSDAGALKWQTVGQLKLGVITSLNTVTTTTAGTITAVVADGNQSGVGARISIESVVVDGLNTIKTVTVTTVGTTYAPGETITITKAVLDASALGVSSGDLILTLDSSNINLGDFSTTSYNSLDNAGGGNWYTGSNLELPVIQSQSFSYGIGVDLSVDVTDTIKTWYTNSIVDDTVGFPNDGFLVKQSSSKEFVNSQATTATFRYFSIDTNTIYPPLLDLKWNDWYYNTGSSTNKTLETPEAFISIYNNAGTYYSQSEERFRIAAIPKYPDVVFQTASLYTTNFYLPQASSSYAIKDTDTNEFVIPFDSTYTQISSDTTSSYFDIYMNGLEPERYYTILVKTTVGGTTKVFDEGIMFKVVNG